MLREFLSLLKDSDPLRELYATLIRMITDSGRMLETAWGEVAAGRVRPEIRQEVEAVDVEINKAERLIRRRVAEHLVVRPGADVPPCLVLMSVVKDAERIGDHCKDILDLAEMTPLPLSQGPDFEALSGLYRDTRGLLEKLRGALSSSDRKLAEEVMLSERDIRGRCESYLHGLVAEATPSRTVVPRALLARYLQRTAAHVSNVASSLVMPLHKLDYHDPEWLGKGEPRSS